eukprot:6281507-Pyramimonas_sp.AAC.1
MASSVLWRMRMRTAKICCSTLCMRARTDSASLARFAPAAAKQTAMVLPSTRRRGATPRTLSTPSRWEWTNSTVQESDDPLSCRTRPIRHQRSASGPEGSSHLR